MFEFLTPYLDYIWGILFIIGAFVAHIVISTVHKKLTKTISKTHFVWDSALIKAVRGPLLVLLWGTTVILIVQYSLKVVIVRQQHAWINLSVIAIFFWFFLRFIKFLESGFVSSQRTHHKKYDKTTVRAVSQLMRVVAFVIAILMALQSTGVSVSAVLAFGGAGGLVVGLAAKDLLANFFGGLMIYLDRPFAIGDWIRSPDKEIEGVVDHIGWRLTRIRTFDRRPLYVPNGVFSTVSVENPSRMSHRRILETISIRYDDAKALKKITQEIRDYLTNHEEIDQTLTNIVRFNGYGQSSLDILLNTYVKTTDWGQFHVIKESILCDIMDIITQNGAELAYPTSRRIREV